MRDKLTESAASCSLRVSLFPDLKVIFTTGICILLLHILYADAVFIDCLSTSAVLCREEVKLPPSEMSLFNEETVSAPADVTSVVGGSLS